MHVASGLAQSSSGRVMKQAAPLSPRPQPPSATHARALHATRASPAATVRPGCQHRYSQRAATSAQAATDKAAPLKLRAGTKADLPAIATAVLKEWLNPLGLDPTRFLVATTPGPQGEELVAGWGQLKPLEARPHGGTVYELRTLVTVKEHRGKGVASAVVAALLQRVSPADRVILLTTRSTLPFYQKLGFKPVSTDTALPGLVRFEYNVGSVIARIATGGQTLVVLEATKEQKEQ